MTFNSGMGSAMGITNPFKHNNYLLSKQMLKLLGGSFRIYNPNGEMVLFASLKAFRLKEDIRLYTGEDKLNEVLVIQARQMLDISATYDVVDSMSGQPVGALRRRGLKSMFRDEWTIIDVAGNEVGTIMEDSMMLALLRRLLTNLVPQRFHGEMGGMPVLTFQQNFNPFTLKLQLDFSADMSGKLDRRLGIAAAVLIAAVEGRETS